MLNVRGLDGNEDPMGEARRYLDLVSQAVQTRALLAGVRAYLATVRKAAQSTAPFSAFRQASGYRMGARATRRGEVRGYVYSAYPGNIIEAGAVSHYAPIQDDVDDKTGQVTAGLGTWLRQHAPELLSAWMKGRKTPPRFARVKAMAARPWVIPAAESVDSAASEAFLDAVIAAIDREVTK